MPLLHANSGVRIGMGSRPAKRNKQSKLHMLCSGRDVTAVQETALNNRSAVFERDSRGLLPVHIACANHNEEGPEMVSTLLTIEPLCARHTDNLLQLPLHIACRNPGPTNVTWDDRVERPNVVRLLETLLGTYRQGVLEEDMDGMLPLHWALRNRNSEGALEAINMLLSVYPDAAIPQGFNLGGHGVDAAWSSLVLVNQQPDKQMDRFMTMSSAVLPMTRIWADGHHRAEDDPNRVMTADIRDSDPTLQVKRIFFDALRNRLDAIYSNRQKRSKMRKELREFTTTYSNQVLSQFSEKPPISTVTPEIERAESTAIVETAVNYSAQRCKEWLRFGAQYPHILALVPELPQVHTPSLVSVMMRRMDTWHKAMSELHPKDVVTVLEHLPAHIAAAQPVACASELLTTILLVDPRCTEARDALGRTPLHVACANESAHAEAIVAAVLESNPESASAQDHDGMLPLHHACLNSGPVAGSIAGRLIAVFSPAAQVADDFGRLPLDCCLYCRSESLSELIKAVGRAFPPATRILDGDGNTVMHRACFEIERNPQCAAMVAALVELGVRPNPCAIFNFHQQLPMHIAASSSMRRASHCLSHLVDAYIPGAWAKDAHGDSALHHAIRARNLQSVTILTAKSRDKAKHIQNDDGDFPLNLATTRQLREAICSRGDPTGDNPGASRFQRFTVTGLGVLWFTASCFIWVDFLPVADSVWFVLQTVLLVLWLLVTVLNIPSVNEGLYDTGWLGAQVAVIVTAFKGNEGQMLVFPLAILQCLISAWIDAEISYTTEVTAACATLLVAHTAVREDGSRFHALELNVALLYLEVFVMFVYRVAEFISRVAVLTLAFMDANHCACFSNLECGDCFVKQPTLGVLVAEAALLLLFFRVGSAEKKHVQLQIDEHIRTWWAGYFNMLGVFFCPPHGTMLTYLGVRQSHTAFLGEVKVYDAGALIVLRAISNITFLVLVSEVPPVYDGLWSMAITGYLLWSAAVGIPMQAITAYLRFLIWQNFETKETAYFSLMSKREKILSERAHDAVNDQIKELNDCLSNLADEKRELDNAKLQQKGRHHHHHHHHHHRHHHHHHRPDQKHHRGQNHHHQHQSSKERRNSKHYSSHATQHLRQHPPQVPLHSQAKAPTDLHPSASPVRIRPQIHGERMVLPVRRTKTPFLKQLPLPPQPMSSHGFNSTHESTPLGQAASAMRDTDSIGVARPTSPGNSGIHNPNVVRPTNVVGVMNRETHKKGLHGHGVISVGDESSEEEEEDIDEVGAGDLSHTTGKRQFFYIDELLADTSILDQPDCFLLFDTKVFMPECCARRLHRPWSSDMINVKIIFSADSLNRSMWKVKTQLQQTLQGSAEGTARAISSQHAPVVFNRARLRLSLADVLQIVPEQIIVDDPGTPADSEAEMLVLPSKRLADERSPEQLFLALETLLMNPHHTTHLPAPLGLAVSCNARTMPYSPFAHERHGEEADDPKHALPWRNEGGGVHRAEFEDALRRFEQRQYEEEYGELYADSDEGGEESASESGDSLSSASSASSENNNNGASNSNGKGIWGQMVYHVDSTVNNPMRMEALRRDLQIGRSIIDDSQQKKPWTVTHTLDLPAERAELDDRKLKEQKLHVRASFKSYQQKHAAREVRRALSGLSEKGFSSLLLPSNSAPVASVAGGSQQSPAPRVRRFMERHPNSESQRILKDHPARRLPSDTAQTDQGGVEVSAGSTTAGMLLMRRRRSSHASDTDGARGTPQDSRDAAMPVPTVEAGRSVSVTELQVDGLPPVAPAGVPVLQIRQRSRRRPDISGAIAGSHPEKPRERAARPGGAVQDRTTTGQRRERGEVQQARANASIASSSPSNAQPKLRVMGNGRALAGTGPGREERRRKRELPAALRAKIRQDVGRRMESQDSARKRAQHGGSAATETAESGKEEGLLSGLFGLNSQLVFWADGGGSAGTKSGRQQEAEQTGGGGEQDGGDKGKGGGIRGLGGSSGQWGAKQSLASTVSQHRDKYPIALESATLTDFRVRGTDGVGVMTSVANANEMTLL